MTWIKICGITNLDDALAATDAGANALGFVFYKKSPRHVTLETARSIVAKLPKRMEKVGLFVNETVDHVRDTAQQLGLTAVQLHGDESTEFSRALFQELANAGSSAGSRISNALGRFAAGSSPLVMHPLKSFTEVGPIASDTSAGHPAREGFFPGTVNTYLV